MVAKTEHIEFFLPLIFFTFMCVEENFLIEILTLTLNSPGKSDLSVVFNCTALTLTRLHASYKFLLTSANRKDLHSPPGVGMGFSMIRFLGVCSE